MADKEPLEILEKISDMYDYAHDALKQFPRDERGMHWPATSSTR